MSERLEMKCKRCGDNEDRTDGFCSIECRDKFYLEEDIAELTTRIAELEAEKDILENQLREATNFLIDKKLHVDSLYEEGYKLQQRIAELEAENDQLTAHSDIERQDDKSSNDTQTQTIVYGKVCER